MKVIETFQKLRAKKSLCAQYTHKKIILINKHSLVNLLNDFHGLCFAYRSGGMSQLSMTQDSFTVFSIGS